MTLVAGVDSSTQSCKVVIRDVATGAVVRTGRAAHPDGTAVDPRHWWDALLAAVADAGGLDDVSAIAVGGQQHGMVVLDADGRVIRPALLWNDTRSARRGRDPDRGVRRGGTGAERTGSVPVASFTATKLRWLRDAEPENAARVAAVALPHDWLTWRLRGYGPAGSALGPVLDELVTDRSDASGTSYWSPTSASTTASCSSPRSAMTPCSPACSGPADAAGETVAHPGIPAGLVVGPGAGDNAAAALGLGAHPGDVVVSLGTSGTVFAVTETPTRDASGTVAGFADATGEFLPLIATLNAARVLGSDRRACSASTTTSSADSRSRPSPGAGGIVLQPYFEGERTPNLPDATASLFGMTLRLDHAREPGACGRRGDAVRAGRRPRRRARRRASTLERVLLIGGAAANPAVSAVAAQVFDAPVEVPAPGEYVALGAAAQAAWVLTGERPSWAREVLSRRKADPQPVIRAQYAAHRIGA